MLIVLFPTVPLVIAAQCAHFGQLGSPCCSAQHGADEARHDSLGMGQARVVRNRGSRIQPAVRWSRFSAGSCSFLLLLNSSDFLSSGRQGGTQKWDGQESQATHQRELTYLVSHGWIGYTRLCKKDGDLFNDDDQKRVAGAVYSLVVEQGRWSGVLASAWWSWPWRAARSRTTATEQQVVAAADG